MGMPDLTLLPRNVPRLRHQIIVGMIVVLVLVITHKLRPYINGEQQILPVCVTCHNQIDSAPSFIFKYGRVLCIDHLKMDGSKLSRSGIKVAESPNRPPFKYIHKRYIKDLVSPDYTKYEIFCAEVGHKLQKKYPKLRTIRHTVVDRKSTRFVVYANSSTSFVDAPIDYIVRLKELPRKKLFGQGGVEFIRHMYGPRDDSIIHVKDWRFLHDHNININHPCVDKNGHELYSWMITILKTNDAYYAVEPIGINY